jgi:hypothetical protein
VGAVGEGDADLAAIDPDQPAAAVGEARRGQHQKELGEPQVDNGIADGQSGTAVGDIVDRAFAPPSAIDRHQLGRHLMLELDARTDALLQFAHGTATAS